MKICREIVFVIFASLLLYLTVAASGDSLEEKISELVMATKSSSVIPLTGDTYRKFVKNQPRNYSVVVMLTAMDSRRGCALCGMAADEFKIVADSFRSGSKAVIDTRLFFAMADYDNVAQIFNDLDINTAPSFIHFPASGVRTSSDTLDIQRFGFGADVIAKWINRQTEIHVQIFRPPSYGGTLLLALFMCLGASMMYFKRDSLGFLQNRSFWAFITMNVIFYMISGQVWNHIRGPPLMNQDRQGRLTAIYPGSDYQFIAETIIVMILYIVISMSFILVHEMQSIADPSKRKTLAIVALAMCVLGLSFLIHVFRRKYQGYPYTFLIS